jgi:hypothetical protein
MVTVPENGQNRRLLGSPSHDPAEPAPCTLPPAGSGRVRSIDFKNDFAQPCPLSTPCRDSRSPSSSHPPDLLKRHTTSQAGIHHCEKNFPARFSSNPSVQREAAGGTLKDVAFKIGLLRKQSSSASDSERIRSHPPVQPDCLALMVVPHTKTVGRRSDFSRATIRRSGIGRTMRAKKAEQTLDRD